MAQPIAVNDVLELTLEGSIEQQPFALVRHYLVTGVTSATDMEDAIITHWVNTLIPKWKELATSLTVFECMTISRVAPGPRNPYYTQFVPAVVGDISTDGLPPMNAVLCRLTSDEPGRRNQGRAYLVGCPEASTNGGVLLASVEADWNELAEYIKTPIASAGNDPSPVIFSRTNYNPAADPPQAVTVYTAVITGAAVQGNIATIRNRRTKRSSFSA